MMNVGDRGKMLQFLPRSGDAVTHQRRRRPAVAAALSACQSLVGHLRFTSDVARPPRRGREDELRGIRL